MTWLLLQLPLQPSCVITDYLSQGSTIDAAICDFLPLASCSLMSIPFQSYHIPAPRTRTMHDFALWRPFPKEVLEHIKVPQDLLHDQKRLRTIEQKTITNHQQTIQALLQSIQAIKTLANAEFDVTKFTTALANMNTSV